MGDEVEIRKAGKPGSRAERLAAELRANLARRKAQARTRRSEVAGSPPPPVDAEPDPSRDD